MYVYMEVTADKYELPIAIADTSAELCRIRGLNPSTVISTMRKCEKRGWKCKYVKVDIGEMDDDPLVDAREYRYSRRRRTKTV